MIHRIFVVHDGATYLISLKFELKDDGLHISVVSVILVSIFKELFSGIRKRDI